MMSGNNNINEIINRFESCKNSVKINFQEISGYTPKEYYTNSMHAYPAKMLHQIPRALLPFYASKGETVLDCFCGCGTTLMQARLYGMNAIGMDINPLPVLLSRVKSATVNVNKLMNESEYLLKRIDTIDAPKILDFPNRDFWFEKEVQRDLARIIEAIQYVKYKKYREFFLVCASSIVREVSNADPDVIPPVKSKKMRKKIAKGREINTIDCFRKAVQADLERIAAFSKACVKSSSLKVKIGDARNMEDIEDNSVDLVMTSPPYLSAQKYVRSLQLETYWLGLANNSELRDIDLNTIGTERVKASNFKDFESTGIEMADEFVEKIKKRNIERAYIVYKYFVDMEKAIREIYRVLKPEKHYILVIGNNTVTRLMLPNHKILSQIAQKIGFVKEREYEDKIKYRGFMTKRNETAGLIDSEWVLIFKK